MSKIEPFCNDFSNCTAILRVRRPILIDLAFRFDNIGLGKELEDGKLYYKIIVEDNGPGISDEFKLRIFDRHLRGSTKAKGSGIGLYLVKTLIKSYDGKAWVEDRIQENRSEGSRFVVMLPAHV